MALAFLCFKTFRLTQAAGVLFASAKVLKSRFQETPFRMGKRKRKELPSSPTGLALALADDTGILAGALDNSSEAKYRGITRLWNEFASLRNTGRQLSGKDGDCPLLPLGEQGATTSSSDPRRITNVAILYRACEFVQNRREDVATTMGQILTQLRVCGNLKRGDVDDQMIEQLLGGASDLERKSPASATDLPDPVLLLALDLDSWVASLLLFQLGLRWTGSAQATYICRRSGLHSPPHPHRPTPATPPRGASR